MAVTVRDIRRDDLEAIAAVHVGAWLAAYRGLMDDAFLDSITVPAWADRWREWLAAPELPEVRVATLAETVVGFSALATPSRDEDAGPGVAEVVALNVGPDAWRRKVGTALMTDALDRFRRDNWTVATLWVVEGNERAFAFYERHGFTLDGATTVHKTSGATELRMRRVLSG